MTTRLPLLCCLLFATAGPVLSQERQFLFEEIQKRPDQIVGEWIIGGRPMIANESTRLDSVQPAVVGDLVAVEYIKREEKAFITQLIPQPVKAADVTDGPYVKWLNPTTAEVTTLVEGKLIRNRVENITAPRKLKNLNPLVESITLDPQLPTPPKSQWEMPDRLLAISDLEGNYLNALHFLQNNKIVDEHGHWCWGNGHLVLVGDLVDRGQSVAELMWMVRRLEREAQTAGGQVHYVLGNHETMVMAGDLRYIHRKYHFTSTRIGTSYDQLHGAETDIGRWWRSKNSLIRVGDLLFVHGGYSPQLDQADLDFDALNRLIRAGLPPARPMGQTPETNPVWHSHGPFWYRGYFKDHAAAWGGLASQSAISRILDRHRARHIVVGHTVVDEVGPIDQFGSVIGIDVKWTDARKCQGLLQEGNRLYRLTMMGERVELLAGTTK